MSNQEAKAPKTFVITVMSRDRVGIVSDLTKALNRFQANIERISQTVVMNYFTLTLIVTFSEEYSPDTIREEIIASGSENELEVTVAAYEKGAIKTSALTDSDCFILTVTGQDQRGIIGQIAGYLAGKGVNITDLYAEKKSDEFLLISELAVPKEMNIAQIQIDIEALGKQIGLVANLQHENIFKATNEVKAPSNF